MCSEKVKNILKVTQRATFSKCFLKRQFIHLFKNKPCLTYESIVIKSVVDLLHQESGIRLTQDFLDGFSVFVFREVHVT